MDATVFNTHVLYLIAQVFVKPWFVKKRFKKENKIMLHNQIVKNFPTLLEQYDGTLTFNKRKADI